MDLTRACVRREEGADRRCSWAARVVWGCDPLLTTFITSPSLHPAGTLLPTVSHHQVATYKVTSSEQNVTICGQTSTYCAFRSYLPQGYLFRAGHAVVWWLRHCATNRKVVSSIHGEVIFFLIYLILLAALGPGVYSASKRNEYQKHKNNNVSGE
jgi:hypothetical protein